MHRYFTSTKLLKISRCPFSFNPVKMVLLTLFILIQLPRIRGLTSPQYTVAIRLIPDRTLVSESMLYQQSARTCGSSSDHLSSEIELISWNEVFFFKVDSPVCSFKFISSIFNSFSYIHCHALYYPYFASFFFSSS